jgi:hypothetical protein
MSLNFNTQPYYDDFNEDKNFHKILFKPGVAVQARELTQAQSILQDQIGKFGKFVLADGSNVTGGQYYIDNNAKSLNLVNTGSLSTDIENFTGLYVVGSTSKCVGLITSTDIINFYLTIKPITNAARNFISGETLEIFTSKISALNYTQNSSISSDYTAQLSQDIISTVFNVYGEHNSYTLQINSSSIEIGDVITFGSTVLPQYIVVEIGPDSTYIVDKKLQIPYNNATATITKFASRTVLEVGISDGVYFTNNHFVKALSQTIVPNIKTQYPSCVIGFEVTETIVDFIDDTSLLDPAQGSYNYTAPGADRYKIYLQLVAKNLLNPDYVETDSGIDNLTTAKFIELLRIKNGIVIKDNTDPKLGELENTLARQMYDHAGNFIVSPYNISFQESDFTDIANTVNAEISAGKAYVFGYEFDTTFPTHLVINKARETAQIQDYTTLAYYGNHITIKNVNGSIPNPSSGAKIELHSNTKNQVTADSRIGYAYVRNIQYVSTDEYYLNLYNISATQNDIANTKSVILTSSSNYAAATFSANVIQENSTTTLIDSGFNKLLYELPYKNVASLSNTSITLDVFDTLTVSTNTVSIHTGTLTKKFPSGVSANLPTDLKNNHFLISTKTTNGSYSAGQYVDLSDVNIKTELVGSEYVATLDFINGYSGIIDIKYGLEYDSATKKTKTLTTNYVSQILSDVYPKSLGRADIASFKGVYKSTDIRANYIGVWSSSTTYSASDVVLYGEKLFVSSSNSNTGNSPQASSSNWNELRDVTSRYTLNNGQTEFMYDHGTVTAKTSADCGTVFVILDYYEHSSSGEYISFDSYPNLTYSKIPVVFINDIEYNLKNYIDFRPRKSNDATTILYDTYKIPSSDFTGFNFDMSYYLGRIDKLVLTKEKKFQWLTGKSSYYNYVPPADLIDAMTLATIQFDPYTSTQSDVIVKYSKHRRYTMDDIGKLDTRIQNVEYYTSLNLVEKDVMSRNIIDNVTGSRMKNGFVVDPFVGYGVMSLTDNYKNISLDLAQQLARPSFSTKYENVVVNNIGDLNQQNDLISFPYTESQVTLQYVPTGVTNINPFDTISYTGNLMLSPQSDIWVDTENKPIINVLNDNAAAIRDASSVPGLMFDEWNTYYATHPYTDLSGSVDVIYNNVDYKISTTKVVQSDIVTEVSNTVIPYARSIPITFKATNLAPLTKMYVYVNGRMVNAYVKPTLNPTGQITGATITNPGTGYLSSNTALALPNTSITTANVGFSIAGTTVNGVELIDNGSGYSTDNILSPTITGMGSSGSLNLTTIQPIAGDLFTNEAGDCEGILYLPNDSLLRFPAGELLITICDTPNYDFESYAMAKAQATFYSSGRYRVLQETITSIRQPYIKKAGEIVQPQPESGCKIVVQNQINYLVNHYAQPYNNIKTGTLKLPVYLNVEPKDTVTVTFINASEDMSSNSSISFSPTSLTFNPSNYKTTQEITLTYNLGDRAISSGNYIDNMLPTYIEYYSSSNDTRYNYIGTVKPIKSWTKDYIVTGVTTSKLFPYSILDPNQVLPESTPYLTVSPIQTSVTNGKTYFTVSYGGGSEIGWWSLNDNQTYPLTFTAVSDNTSVYTVQSSTYEHYDVSNTVGGATRTVNKLDQEVLTFKYFLAANNAGTANVIVTTTSTNSNWNGITANTSGIVSSSLSSASPAIIVHPNITISPSSGTVTGGTRYTTESGGSHSIAISLSKAPTQSVTVTANCLNLAEAFISGKSEDGLTIVSGNTVTFTPSTWNSVKAIVVTGIQDYLQDGDVPYTVKLSSTSSDSSFNGLITNVPLVNSDVVIPKGEAVVNIIGKNHTTEQNGKVRLSITLNKKPTQVGQVITATVTSSDTTEGLVTSPVGGLLYFNENTWNIPQMVEITGQEDAITDGDFPYKIYVDTSTPTFTEWSNSRVSVDLINDDYVYATDLWVSTDTSRAYSATPLGRPATSWVPSISISGETLEDAGYVSSAYSPLVEIISVSKNSVAIKASCILTPAYYSSNEYTHNGWCGVKFNINTNNPDTLISKLAKISASVSGSRVTVNSRTNKSINVTIYVYNGGYRGAIRCYNTLTLDGLFFDAISSGIRVTETLTTTTTNKVIRLDTYAVVSTTTATTTSQQIVPYDINPETYLAAYNSIIGYPLSSVPGEGVPAADVAAALNSANLYRKNNVLELIKKQKQLVDNIIAKISVLSPNTPATLDRSLVIETYNLNSLNLRLQTL